MGMFRQRSNSAITQFPPPQLHTQNQHSSNPNTNKSLPSPQLQAGEVPSNSPYPPHHHLYQAPSSNHPNFHPNPSRQNSSNSHSHPNPNYPPPQLRTHSQDSQPLAPPTSGRFGSSGSNGGKRMSMDGDMHRVMSGGQGGGKEEGKKRRTFLGMHFGGDKDKEVSLASIPLRGWHSEDNMTRGSDELMARQ